MKRTAAPLALLCMTTPQGTRREGDRGGPPTRWTLISRAQGHGPQARVALGELLKRYESTVVAHIRVFGHPWSDSPEDLAQEFFAQMLRRREVQRLDPAKGRFRGWLYVAVHRFMCNAWRRWKRMQRGNLATAPCDFDVVQPWTAEHVQLRAFAQDTIRHVAAQLRAKHGSNPRFEQLQRFLPGPGLDLSSQAEVAEALGMTATALAVAIHRLREDFKSLLHAAVADAIELAPDADGRAVRRAVQAEIRELYGHLHEAPPLLASVRPALKH